MRHQMVGHVGSPHDGSLDGSPEGLRGSAVKRSLSGRGLLRQVIFCAES